MIEIEIREGLSPNFDPGGLDAFIRKALELAEVSPESELSLVITDNTEIRQLNREYLGADAPTDVLSFPLDFDNPETGSPYLGDIVISLPTAAQQAEAGGHALIEEIKLLVVHGILHLLGHDHADLDEKAAMWQIQEQILTSLEVNARPTES